MYEKREYSLFKMLTETIILYHLFYTKFADISTSKA